MSLKLASRLGAVLLSAVLLTGAACQQPSTPATPTPGATVTPETDPASPMTDLPTPAKMLAQNSDQAIEHSLKPLPGKGEEAPVLTQKTVLKMVTDAGDITIEVYPEAAPNAAARFVELAESGFYDQTPVSRVVDGFVAQFGVNWRTPHVEFKEKNFDDDPTWFRFEPGTLAFAKAGPNTNSTQVFINYGNNDRLAAPEFNFSIFGKVVEGMDVVRSFKQVGDPSGGLDQERLWTDGGAYLESLSDKPTMIESLTVVETP